MLGIDPRPFTLRHLSRMATGRRRDQWDHTAAMMNWMGRFVDVPFEPDKLNPYRQSERREQRQLVDPGRAEAMGWAALEAGLRRLKG